MTRIAFVVPCHGRLELAAICLRQLRRTCDLLTDAGIGARAVVISDRESLADLDPLALGFATVERDNSAVSRKFNDGIQLATDPKYGIEADYVVPFGSDNWADHRLFLDPLPGPFEVQGFQTVAFVNEDATELASTYLGWEGGSGLRIIPRTLVAPLGYRPCDEDRPNGCDTSTLINLKRHHRDRMKVTHAHLHGCQIVDWKSRDEQLHSYEAMTSYRKTETTNDPFGRLAEFYPAAALEEMRAYYEPAVVCA